MKKLRTRYEFCLIVAFIGMLLTFLIVYLVNAAVDGRADVAPTCYDGTVIEGDGAMERFDRAVYQGGGSLDGINAYRYRLFGVVDHPNVIAGKNDFLFEVEKESGGYNYIEDYLGRASFSEGDTAKILHTLLARKAGYAQRGALYLVVVLPNAQCVYSDCMPAYLGEISGDTRLQQLEEKIAAQSFPYFINPLDDLIADKQKGLVYNNTENTLNSRGFFSVYRAVCDRISPTAFESIKPLAYDALEFNEHATRGRAVAAEAGLAEVVKNRTVTLSGNTKLNYRIVHDSGYVSVSERYSLDFPTSAEGSPSLLLQFPSGWERSQAEPYFSNTFGRVTYQIGYDDDPNVFSLADPDIVVQFIREDELSLLLK